MLAYSEKLTLKPSEMTEEDVQSLRDASLTEEEILGVLWVAGFFNLATRLADALGVELDPEHIPGTPEYTAIMSRKPEG